MREDLSTDGSDSRRASGKRLLPLGLRVQLVDPVLETDYLSTPGPWLLFP